MKTLSKDTQIYTQSPVDAEIPFADDLLSPISETPLEDLILEHFTGRHDGLLRAALDFLQTQSGYPLETVLEAALAEGFGEEEIAAALHLLESRENGDTLADALWSDGV